MIVPRFWNFPEYNLAIESAYQVRATFPDGKSHIATDINAGYWDQPNGYACEAYETVISDPHYHRPLSLFASLHEEARRLSEDVTKLTGFPHIHVDLSGCDVVGTAINMADRIRPDRVIMSLQCGNHGSLPPASCASGYPNIRQSLSYIKHERFECMEPNEQSLKRIRELGSADKLCCVLFEPVQGVNGCFIVPHEFTHALFALRQQYHFFIIADEVATFWWSGYLLASQFFSGVNADMVCWAKALSGYEPISLVLLTDEVFRAHEKIRKWFYGTTAGGHPLACKLARVTLGMYRNGGEDRVRIIGRLLDQLSLQYNITLRGIKTMRAIDFGKKERADSVSYELLTRHGFHALNEGRYISLRPMIVLPNEEIVRFFQVIKQYV